MLGYIRRSTLNIRDLAIRRTLYRSHLEYATQVWAPQTVELVKKVERVQRRATKYILNVPFICDIDYKDRLLAARMLPLSYWHEYPDMIFFYKANHGIFTVPVDKLLSKNLKDKQDRLTSTRTDIHV